jgi:hypothetical protein
VLAVNDVSRGCEQRTARELYHMVTGEGDVWSGAQHKKNKRITIDCCRRGPGSTKTEVQTCRPARREPPPRDDHSKTAAAGDTGKAKTKLATPWQEDRIQNTPLRLPPRPEPLLAIAPPPLPSAPPAIHITWREPASTPAIPTQKQLLSTRSTPLPYPVDDWSNWSWQHSHRSSASKHR